MRSHSAFGVWSRCARTWQAEQQPHRHGCELRRLHSVNALHAAASPPLGTPPWDLPPSDPTAERRDTTFGCGASIAVVTNTFEYTQIHPNTPDSPSRGLVGDNTSTQYPAGGGHRVSARAIAPRPTGEGCGGPRRPARVLRSEWVESKGPYHKPEGWHGGPTRTPAPRKTLEHPPGVFQHPLTGSLTNNIISRPHHLSYPHCRCRR